MGLIKYVLEEIPNLSYLSNEDKKRHLDEIESVI